MVPLFLENQDSEKLSANVVELKPRGSWVWILCPKLPSLCFHWVTHIFSNFLFDELYRLWDMGEPIDVHSGDRDRDQQSHPTKIF